MNFFKLSISVTAALFIILSQQAFALGFLPKNQTENSKTPITMQPKEVANTKRELDFNLAPIKNLGDLKAYLAITPIESSPLGSLTDVEREIFINSLVFTSKGLASFDYSVLNYGPTVTEVYSILALFGSQSSISSIPNLTITSELDSSIMAAAEMFQQRPVLNNYRCEQAYPFEYYWCYPRREKMCYEEICYTL
ncbi:hypothetical protein [Microbulbifer sp. 2205BS26-8]|uniref:hypothetical protein n=1 Tax=Microbulbifer sp. 2205BS26-8 TaxID=3064386 RepID=UPI00273F4FF1|nr:hypothetical protein [Microbulbifer sp. 2205BS26-8]MDP5211097.1 hypothetical protein [Microbulbifer sp. 2205BS26-8]